MTECRKAGLRLAAAMEKLRVTVPAADTGRPYITPWEENRGTDKAYTYRGRERVAADSPERDAEFEGRGQFMVPRALMARTEGDVGPISIDLIEVNRDIATRWSSSRNEEMNTDKWPV